MARILLALLALDLDFSIPADPNQFGKAPRVILIALVHANRQSCVRMSRVDANHGKIDPSKFVPEPTRHRAGLEADALRMRRPFAKQFSQGARIRLGLSLEQDLPVSLTTHTEVSFCETSSPTYCFMIPSDSFDCVRT